MGGAWGARKSKCTYKWSNQNRMYRSDNYLEIAWRCGGGGDAVAGGKSVIVTGNRDVNAKALR